MASVVNGSYHVQLSPGGEPDDGVPVGPYMPSGVLPMMDDDCAQVEPAVVLKPSPNIGARRAERMVEHRKGTRGCRRG